jgi:general secretion pathway protein C
LSLTLIGAADGVQSASDDPDAPAMNEPAPTLVTAHEANVLPSASAAGALTGTILSAVSGEARAIIADVRGRQRVYARGEEISDGAKLVEIHPDYVVLQRDGRLEALGFSGSTVTRSTQPAPGASQETSPEDHHEDLRDAVFTRPELLLEIVGATVVVEGGHFRGCRVMKPEDPTFLKSLGLEPGDILTEVNGVPLDTTQDYGAELFDTLRGAGRLAYTIRRGSEILVLSY